MENSVGRGRTFGVECRCWNDNPSLNRRIAEAVGEQALERAFLLSVLSPSSEVRFKRFQKALRNAPSF